MISGIEKKVRDYLKRELVSVSSRSSVREAAKVMYDKRVSSVVVLEDGRLYGIFTDFDLRKLIAIDADLDEQIGNVAKKTLTTVEAESSILEALSRMIENGVGHIIVTEGGKPVGILTFRDIAYELGPFYIRYTTQIRRAKDLESIGTIVRSFKDALIREASLYLNRPEEFNPKLFFETISYVVDSAIRAVVRKLPPCDDLVYAVTGSGGRREQFLLTDRDTMAIYTSERCKKFLAELEEKLNSLGFPPCPHGYTADRYSFSVDEIEEKIEEWCSDPESHAVEISLLADARAIFGKVEMLQDAKKMLVKKLYRDRLFLRHSLMYRPALSMLGNLRKSFDFKAGAIAPVEYPVRALAVTNGILELDTHSRIAAIGEERLIPPDLTDDLMHAYTILTRRKIWLQVRGKKQFVAAEFNPMERSLVRDALRVVRKFQEYVERNYL